MRKLPGAFAIFLFAAVSALAQSEGDLKSHFEGMKVTVLMDMPATKDGVNVYPERPQTMDFPEYAQRIKRFGIAATEGDRLMITRIRVKDKHIEFHLGGGGYGTFGDETEPAVSIPSVEKSNREKRLEDELKKETNETRRRQLRDELEDLRQDRERENRRIEAERAAAVEIGKQRIEQRRLQGGSRFNIRYDAAITSSQMTPEAVREALSKYVEFP